MKHICNRRKHWEILKSWRGKDFSEVEDNSNAFELISQIGALAANSAIAEAKAAGLPLVFVRGNEIIRKHQGGREEIMRDQFWEGDRYYYNYQPGTVLYVAEK